MKILLLALSFVVAVAPAHAASKVKKLQKILVCGFSGPDLAEVALQDETVRVVLPGAMDSAAGELERQLQSAGIPIVPFADAEAAAKARFAAKHAETQKEIDSRLTSDSGQGAPPSANEAMIAAATSNPAYTPEMREQIRKAMSGSNGQAAAVVASMKKDGSAKMGTFGKGMHETRVAAGGSRSTGNTRLLCPPPGTEFYGEELAQFTAFLDELGADGWLGVSGNFGFVRHGSSTGAGMRITTKAHVNAWLVEAYASDRKNKRIWAPRKQNILGEPIKLGGSAASAKKAIMADMPNIVAKLVKELAD